MKQNPPRKSIKIGILMDPIIAIDPKKDSSLAMMREAQTRDYQLFYFEPTDIFLENGAVFGESKTLKINDSFDNYFEFLTEKTIKLSDLDVLLIRNNPPFDAHYLHLTHLLEFSEKDGLLIINKPQSIRDFNEKLATNWFSDLMPPSLVSLNPDKIKQFLTIHQKIIVKPLDDMGGNAIFMVSKNDKNTNVILETSTKNGTQLVMVQKFIKEIAEGDKRILLINGKPINYALARIPSDDEFRGNLAKGATAHGQTLSDNDYKICEKIGSVLRRKGLMFVGLDVIGNYVTEINVTSPTGICELDAQFGLNIAGVLFDEIERKLS